MLSLQAVRKSFAKNSPKHRTQSAPDAVAGVDLEVARGELLTLLGPSGCGKTTLLRCIAGFETPDAGSIRIDGVTVAENGRELVGASERGIGFVPQDGALFPHLTVAKNVAFGLGSTPRAARRRRVAEVLDLVGLGDMGSRRPHELSGGQQQRVALARAIAPSPRVVLLDEPFSALDAYMRASLRDEVHRILRSLGITAVMVTHDQEEALSLGDHVAVMREGRLIQVGTPTEIYHRPSDLELATFLGDVIVVDGRLSPAGEVDCELGRLQVPVRRGGSDPSVVAPTPCRVMIRPEDVRVDGAAEGGAPGGGTPWHGAAGGAEITGILEARTFYGHDSVLTISVPQLGRTITTRILGHTDLRIGDDVVVSFTGPVGVYSESGELLTETAVGESPGRTLIGA